MTNSMKIRDSVSQETLNEFKSIAPGSIRKKENDADPITNRDWEEIMGTRLETYQRQGGRIRRKRLILGTVVFWVYGCRCFGEG